MCGFLGWFGPPPGGPDAARGWLDAGARTLAHRGPDDEGVWIDDAGRAGFAFRRLSILDLSTDGHQPMTNETGDVHLVFNGEIYNHRELRARLEARGHRFRSRSDGEVLVHLWEDHGPAMVDHLNGMFAFAVFDARTGEGLLARDHAGIKPLYLVRSGATLLFASEAKVLLDHASDAVSAVALHRYLSFLWVPGKETMWRDVQKLEPAHRIVWRDDTAHTERWWRWDQTPGPTRTGEAWAADLRETLADAVERQLQSDVPVGSFLSGGLDSSAIVGAVRARRPDEPIRTFTMSMGEETDGLEDDLSWARQVAAHVGADAREFMANPDPDLWPRMVWHADEPLADPALLLTWQISQHARNEGVIVLLSGQGGDELGFGYRSHRAMRIGERLGWVPGGLFGAGSRLAGLGASAVGAADGALGRRVVKLLDGLARTPRERALALPLWTSRADLLGVLAPEWRDVDPDDVTAVQARAWDASNGPTDVDRWSAVLYETFLPALNLTYADKAGMAASIEIRVPLLDREVVELAGRIPARWKLHRGESKWVLGEAAAPWIPAGIRTRPKTGFGGPVRAWVRGELHERIRTHLLSDRALARGWFDPGGLERALDDVRDGKRDLAYLVWAIYTLQVWADTFEGARSAFQEESYR